MTIAATVQETGDTVPERNGQEAKRSFTQRFAKLDASAEEKERALEELAKKAQGEVELLKKRRTSYEFKVSE